MHGGPSAPAQGLQLGQGNGQFLPPKPGRGGPDGTRKCDRCSRLFGQRVPYAGHDCFLYMCSHDYTAEQLAKEGFDKPPVSKAEANEQLAKKHKKAVAQRSSRKRMKNDAVVLYIDKYMSCQFEPSWWSDVK